MIEIETGISTNEMKMKKKRDEIFKRMQIMEQSKIDEKDLNNSNNLNNNLNNINSSTKSPVVISNKLKVKPEVKRGFSRDKAELINNNINNNKIESDSNNNLLNPKSQTKKRADSMNRPIKDVSKDDEKRGTYGSFGTMNKDRKE